MIRAVPGGDIICFAADMGHARLGNDAQLKAAERRGGGPLRAAAEREEVHIKPMHPVNESDLRLIDARHEQRTALDELKECGIVFDLVLHAVDRVILGAVGAFQGEDNGDHIAAENVFRVLAVYGEIKVERIDSSVASAPTEHQSASSSARRSAERRFNVFMGSPLGIKDFVRKLTCAAGSRRQGSVSGGIPAGLPLPGEACGDGENYCWLILLMTATASLTFRSVEPSGVSSAMSAQRNLYIATSLKDA